MRSIGLGSKLVVLLAFVLTLGSLVIAGFFVPSIEGDRQKIIRCMHKLQDVYFFESQRYGQHALNLSIAAQIITSERILRDKSPKRNLFTRDALLEQGQISVIRSMMERRKATNACTDAVQKEQLMPAIMQCALLPVPKSSAEALFERFDESNPEVIETMREHVKRIQNVDDEYEKVWDNISKYITEKINDCSEKISVINYKISFHMKLALVFQVLAMLSVLTKDMFGS